MSPNPRRWSSLIHLSVLLLGLSASAVSSQNAPPKDFPDSTDLHTFVTRPDFRAPRFNVSIYQPEKVTPGYWFTAFYTDLQQRTPHTLFMPRQAGPHIYDNNGDLVWSGAHFFEGRTTFDLKVAMINGTEHLTFNALANVNEVDTPGGAGIILDNRYERINSVYDTTGRGLMDGHEFTVIDDGKRALLITFVSRLTDAFLDNDNYNAKTLWIGDNGFAEVDVQTSKSVFSWWSLDHVDTTENKVDHPDVPSQINKAWDYFHLNSIDKSKDGDYLISARYTNALYKISKDDGHIIWTLGGVNSDFNLTGFNFSSQHDARWRSENETHACVTFFNNHGDGVRPPTATLSTVQEVCMDLTTMEATLVNEWLRPDGELTTLRGNAQYLPNGQMWVGWSENCYVTEFDTDGQLVLEAQLASHRMVSYRTAKYNFTGIPSEPLYVKSWVYGDTVNSSVTVTYVSWNGATHVTSWKVWNYDVDPPVLLGKFDKTGFETEMVAHGAAETVYVEAVAKNGTVLGNSGRIRGRVPPKIHEELEKTRNASSTGEANSSPAKGKDGKGKGKGKSRRPNEKGDASANNGDRKEEHQESENTNSENKNADGENNNNDGENNNNNNNDGGDHNNTDGEDNNNTDGEDNNNTGGEDKHDESTDHDSNSEEAKSSESAEKENSSTAATPSSPKTSTVAQSTQSPTAADLTQDDSGANSSDTATRLSTKVGESSSLVYQQTFEDSIFLLTNNPITAACLFAFVIIFMRLLFSSRRWVPSIRTQDLSLEKYRVV